MKIALMAEGQCEEMTVEVEVDFGMAKVRGTHSWRDLH